MKKTPKLVLYLTSILTLVFCAAATTLIDAAHQLTGTVGVANGGTGLATLTANQIYKGNGTSAIAVTTCDDGGTTANTLTCTDTAGIVAPSFAPSGTTATFMDFAQGSDSSAAALCATANSICFQGPTSVTKQLRTWAGTPATGIEHWTNTSGSMPETISAVDLASADVTGILPAANGGVGTQLTMSTIPFYAQSSTQAYSSLTTREAYYFEVTKPITVNKMYWWISTNTTTGTVKNCVYTANGATKVIDVTTTPTGSTGVQTATVSAVLLNPGGYYMVLGCATTCSHTAVAAPVEATSTMYGAGTPAGKTVWHGTVSHTSGTCNTTLGTVTGAVDKTIGFRLDN